MLPGVIVPLLPPLGRGAGGILPAQGPILGRGRATRNAAFRGPRFLREIGRSRTY